MNLSLSGELSWTFGTWCILVRLGGWHLELQKNTSLEINYTDLDCERVGMS